MLRAFAQATRNLLPSGILKATAATSLSPALHQEKLEEQINSDSELFCNVQLGDTLHHERYTALRKLGYGQYSTVWLAHDSKTKAHVALKLLRSDCYGGEQHIYELEMLRVIKQKSHASANIGHKHVVQLLDHFEQPGVHGAHVCLVFPVLGHHLGHQTIKFHNKRLPVKVAKEITRQILQGLDFLHRECNIIHTDLKPSNILLEIENVEAVIEQYLEKTSPRTSQPTENERTTMPLSEVINTPLISEMSKIHLRIIDFGVSSWVNKHLSEHIQSPKLRAPEVILGAPWSTGVDIWTLGCLVVEFVKGHMAFNTKAAPNGAWTQEDDHLAQIMEILGPIPKTLLAKGERTGKFFDADGNLLRIPKIEPTTLCKLMDGDHEILRRPQDMPESELPMFVHFLQCLLAIDPAQRFSAAQMLKHPWLATTE